MQLLIVSTNWRMNCRFGLHSNDPLEPVDYKSTVTMIINIKLT